MCFYRQSGRNFKIKKATKDIVVWKAFGSSDLSRVGFNSYYQAFFYRWGETYYENKLDTLGSQLHKGLHSYGQKIVAKKECTWYIIKCIIPEGAVYFYNSENKEYISDYITIGNKEDVIKNY